MPFRHAFSTAWVSGSTSYSVRAVHAVRQVQDAHVHAVVAAMRDDPVDRRDHLRDVDSAGPVACTNVQDARVGGHPEEVERAARVGLYHLLVPACDDRSHVRAVPVSVEVAQAADGRIERDVEAIDDLAGSQKARHGCNTGVDHGDIDAGAGVARLPELLRARVERRLVERAGRRRAVDRGGGGTRGDQRAGCEGEPDAAPASRPRISAYEICEAAAGIGHWARRSSPAWGNLRVQERQAGGADAFSHHGGCPVVRYDPSAGTGPDPSQRRQIV